jgi:hypothetical protein
LPELPSSKDNAHIVEKICGQGGMSARHLIGLMQIIFDIAYKSMRQKAGREAARKLLEVS